MIKPNILPIDKFEYKEPNKDDLLEKYEKLNKDIDEVLVKIKKKKIEGKNGSPKR